MSGSTEVQSEIESVELSGSTPITAAGESIYALLQRHSVPYERFDHPAARTCEEADRVIPFFDAARTKNLFLRDSSGRRHFLLTVRTDKIIDFKSLARHPDLGRVGLASETRLEKHLGLRPGCLSMLSMVNDLQHHVGLIVDEDIWTADRVLCHPLINTSTLIMAMTDLRRLLSELGHNPLVVKI